MKTESLAKQFFDSVNVKPVTAPPEASFRDEIANVQLWTAAGRPQDHPHIEVELTRFPHIVVKFPIIDGTNGRAINREVTYPLHEPERETIRKITEYMVTANPYFSAWAYPLADAHFAEPDINSPENYFSSLLDSAYLTVKNGNPTLCVAFRDRPGIHVIASVSRQYGRQKLDVTYLGDTEQKEWASRILRDNGKSWRRYVDTMFSVHFGVKKAA